MKLFERNTRGGSGEELPLVPLKDLVVFPHMVIPFFATQKGATLAVDEAMAGNRRIFLCPQKSDVKDPSTEDLYENGTIAHILQMMRLPDGSYRILAEGKARARIATYTARAFPMRVRAVEIGSEPESAQSVSSLIRTTRDSFRKWSEIHGKVPEEVTKSVDRAAGAHQLVDIIASQVPLDFEQKVELLGREDAYARLEELAVNLEAEIEALQLRHDISSRVKQRLEKGQRDYFIGEQIKELKREIGKEDDDPSGAQELESRIAGKPLPEQVREKALKELDRLRKLQPISPEAGIVRTYLDWIVELPWEERTDDRVDIEEARRILDEDHYDMEKPKERILEYLAVSQLAARLKGPILCFVGPPGTGKTSLGKSLARSLGRAFIRISLGGVRDEAEVRGHRRTYVGALPGKIVQSMRKAGSRNPVFLLDEVDKMSSDFRGDPASALLEVLDPEQNNTFVDHYLEVPYDLSDVMFITTANTLHNIPYPLRDRMEIIEIPGYTEFEKRRIAEGFLIPKQLRQNGLEGADIRFRADAVTEIIQNYTMESGVRNLEREIATVTRKLAVEAVRRGFRPPEPVSTRSDEAATVDAQEELVSGADTEGERKPEDADHEVLATGAPETLTEGTSAPAGVEISHAKPREGGTGGTESSPQFDDGNTQPRQHIRTALVEISRIKPYSRIVTARTVNSYLGKKKFHSDVLYRETRPGIANGLAWTEVGGRLLPVEVAVFEGRSELILTGSLGDVMKESARTAVSFLRTHSHRFHLPSDFHEQKDIHVHVPEGAIPKDGPSAGITLTAALLSAFTGIAVNASFAMTGEVTLTGRLLSVGGIKEKVLAAHRNKIKNVLLPEDNRADQDELPEEVRKDLQFFYADSILDAIRILFPEDLFSIRAY